MPVDAASLEDIVLGMPAQSDELTDAFLFIPVSTPLLGHSYQPLLPGGLLTEQRLYFVI